MSQKDKVDKNTVFREIEKIQRELQGINDLGTLRSKTYARLQDVKLMVHVCDTSLPVSKGLSHAKS